MLASASAVYAQKKLILGFELGTDVYGENNTNLQQNVRYGNGSAFLSGLDVWYPLSETFALRLQCFETSRTVGISQDIGGQFNTFIVSLQQTDFLIIPVTMKYTVFGTASHGYIFAGPYVAPAISDHTIYHIPSFDFGVTGGIGYFLSYDEIVSIFGEAGYLFGLRNMAGDNSFVQQAITAT